MPSPILLLRGACRAATLLLLASCGGGAVDPVDQAVADSRISEQDVRTLAPVENRCSTTSDCDVLPLFAPGKFCSASSYVAVSRLSPLFAAARDAASRNAQANDDYKRLKGLPEPPCVAPRADEGQPLCAAQQCTIAPLRF